MSEAPRPGPELVVAIASSALFDLGYHTKHVDTIFKRVFGKSKAAKAKKPAARGWCSPAILADLGTHHELDH